MSDTTAWIALGTSVVTGVFIVLKQLRKSKCMSRCCQVETTFTSSASNISPPLEKANPVSAPTETVV